MGKIEEIEEYESIQNLKEWLIGRVADDDDIIIDDLQEELIEQLDEKDGTAGIKGSSAWVENVSRSVTVVPDLGPGVGFVWDGFRKCRYVGNKNALGEPDGEGVLIYENKDSFRGEFMGSLHNRRGILTYSGRTEDGLEKIEGTWQQGLLKGEVREQFINTGWFEGYYRDGVRHGFFREFGPRSMGKSVLRMAGRYYKGVRRGVCWKGMYDNSGWLVGEVDDRGDFTGDDIAYIYPDMKMAIRGEHKQEKLVRGQVCQLLGCVQLDGIKKPVFSELSGQVYEFENPTIKNIALHPMIRDPWEDTKVEVKQSLLPQGGEGLFAKKDIAPKEILALYNGIKIRTSTYASEHMPRSDYKIRLNGDIDMDIPLGYHKLENYCATLAHKANHSFTPNVEWTLFEHPRFGLIRSLTAQKQINKGEEILVNYQMALARSPDWYRVIWLQHMRKIKRGDDSAIQRYIDRQYELQGFRIPIPDSEVLDVPEPIGVDISVVPEEYLSSEYLSEEASVQYARTVAGLREQEEGEPRITEETEIRCLEL